MAIWRRLAADNPAAHQPHLAHSLSNLGISLSEAERRSKALTTTEQAVEIHDRLAADNPAGYITMIHDTPIQPSGCDCGSGAACGTGKILVAAHSASGGGRRLDEQLTGHIAPGTGALAGRYEISSTDPALPAGLPPGSAGSRWSGISGAALLSDDGLGGDMLCGIVRRDRQAVGGTRLTATPAAHLLADDTFRVTLTQHTGWEPVLEPVEAAGLLTPAACERDLNSPAALLRADAEAVAFHGRDRELADLRSWCQHGPPTMTVRVMAGPGGQGKTRLARRLTDLLSQQGWVTGHLRSDLTDYDTPPDFTPLNTALPLLVVVDYAETRPRLLRRLITHLQRSRHRVRVLLLARSDGEWRTDPLNAAPAARSLLAAAPVIGLDPLIARSRPVQDRLTAFSRAAHDLARLLPCVPTVPAHDWAALATSLQAPDDLSHPRYDNALTLQLTALVTLLRKRRRQSLVGSGRTFPHCGSGS